MISANYQTIASRLASALILSAAVAWSSSQVFAATFSVERSISMDQWVTWPDESRWNDDDILDNFPEWQKFVSDKDLGDLKNNGLTTLRVPIDTAVFMHNSDEARQQRLMDGIHKAVKRIRRAGLKVIVDMHTIPYAPEKPALGIDEILGDDLKFVRYKKLLMDVATALKAYDPEFVSLEIINEPKFDCDISDENKIWQAQATQLHQAARQANPDITLIIPGGCYASAEGLSKLDPAAFGDDNIIWTFHSYEPFFLTHQSAGWVGKPFSSFRNLPYPPSKLDLRTVQKMPQENDRFIDESFAAGQRSEAGWFIRIDVEKTYTPELLSNFLRKPFDVAANWADRNGVKRENIFLGEFGFIAQEYGNEFKTDPRWRIAYLKDMIALSEEYGFGWSIWSYGGAFGMVQQFGGEPMPGDPLEKLNLSATN